MTGTVYKSAQQTRKRERVRDNLRFDLPAGAVVFLVALPLCLGIAFASGAPLLAGLVTGIVGGVVVSVVSRSALSVSGPAAGLTVVVLAAIAELGSFEAFATAVIVAGVFQIALGFVRAGIVAYYFPSSVIKGMLAGIGAVLILKQLPHAFGFDADYEGDLSFWQPDGRNTLTEIGYALEHVDLGATTIALVGLTVLVVWGRVPKLRRMRYLPGPLVVVVGGIALNALFSVVAPDLSVSGELLVTLPKASNLRELFAQLHSPDFGALLRPDLYRIAAVIAVIASIETLLCVEAIDKLDPLNRITPASHELKAQGVGNVIAGLLGGIPMTAVIVRGSANVQSGGRSWVSAFFHGWLLLISILAVPWLLSRIPLAALAAILLHIGYKLAPLQQFRRVWREGASQFIPFIVTMGGIVFLDLLIGVAVGLAAGIFFVLRAHVSAPFFLHRFSKTTEHGHERVRIELAENVSFLNKASLNALLHSFPEGAVVEIDASKSQHIDHDALEIIKEFAESAPARGIQVSAEGLGLHLSRRDESTQEVWMKQSILRAMVSDDAKGRASPADGAP